MTFSKSIREELKKDIEKQISKTKFLFCRSWERSKKGQNSIQIWVYFKIYI